MLGHRLLSLHNVRFLIKLTERIRAAIAGDSFYRLKEEIYREYGLYENEKDF
jgi:queuine tRNA-ribosyltransferase